MSSEDLFALRDALTVTRLSVRTARTGWTREKCSLELYGMGRHATAHLYAVPVLEGFDAVRNCSHCCRSTDDDCKAWRKLRKSVAALRQECRRHAKGVEDLLETTGGRPATIYEYRNGSVAYFAPEAPDFVEAGELKGDDLAAARRILDERGLPGGNAG